MSRLSPEDFPDPYHTFLVWLHEEVTSSSSKFPAAAVLSTQGLDGFPNARTISLKELHHPHFIFTSSMSSLKSLEIEASPKVALTFWWERSLRQVRIQGIASQISEEQADFYFSERSKSAQVANVISETGAPLEDMGGLKQAHAKMLIDFQEKPLIRPANWKGFKVAPTRMEFMEFKESRLHHRVLYQLQEGRWEASQLQP
ncbi:MAG: pyridoxal 5'-phosphate synthase [Bacteroidota bacterium]